MSSFRSLVVALAAAAPAPLLAQPSPRLAVGIALDAESVPDAFSSRCGRENTGTLGWGVNASAVARPRRLLVVQANAHVIAQHVPMGCITSLPIVRVSPTEYETRPGAAFPSGTPRVPMAMTTVRVGVETPRGLPLLRASVGGGAVWGRRTLPVAVGALTVTSRRPGTRWLVEYEYAVSSTAASEERKRFTQSLGTPTLAYVEPLHLYPRWGTLRAGVEIPLARR